MAARNLKLSRFDLSRKLLGERRINDLLVQMIDEHAHVAEEITADERGLFKKIVYVEAEIIQ